MCVICACSVVIIQFYVSFLHVSDDVVKVSMLAERSNFIVTSISVNYFKG